MNVKSIKQMDWNNKLQQWKVENKWKFSGGTDECL